jgi:uncharacterized protein YuzE
MNIKYFKDTDTALLEFSDQPVDETREISESVFVDLDKDGNLVSMTLQSRAGVAAAAESFQAPAILNGNASGDLRSELRASPSAMTHDLDSSASY